MTDGEAPARPVRMRVAIVPMQGDQRGCRTVVEVWATNETDADAEAGRAYRNAVVLGPAHSFA